MVRPVHTAALVLALTVPPPLAAQRPLPLDTLRVAAASRLFAEAAAPGRSVTVLDRAAIAALPARSVADVLARALGVDLQARSAAQADLSIRGSGFEQVLVMVDGVPVNDDQTGHFHLNLAVPLDAVERIELLRGPASAVHGSGAVGGVVNVVTRRGAPQLAARAEGGSFGAAAGGIEAAARRGRTGARVSAEHDRSDGHRPGTDHRSTQLRAAVDLDVAGGVLRADGGYAARDFGANAFYAPFDSWEETRALTAAVRWIGAPAPFTLEPRLSFRRHEDDFVLRRGDPAFYRNVHTGRQAAAELTGRLRSGPVAAAFGVEAARAELESTNLGDRDEDRVAIFGEATAAAAGGVRAVLGGRLDRHTTFGGFASPSVALSVPLADRLRLRASAARGFRAPNWTERYYSDPANIGDPDLGAEKFWTLEAGAAWSSGTGLELDGAAFVRRATDLIDWARPAGAALPGAPAEPWRTMNVERATFRGVEAVARARVGALELTGEAAALAFSAEAATGYESKYALRPLTRSFALGAHALLPAGIDAAARGSVRRRDEDEWHTLDVRLSRAFRGVTIHVDATNLTDTRYADVIGQPAPGRALGAGLRTRR